MKYTLLGMKILDFTTDKGAKVEGYQLFFISKDPSDDSIIGYRVDKKFMSKTQYAKLGVELKELVEQVVEIACDMSGRIVAIRPAE